MPSRRGQRARGRGRPPGGGRRPSRGAINRGDRPDGILRDPVLANQEQQHQGGTMEAETGHDSATVQQDDTSPGCPRVTGSRHSGSERHNTPEQCPRSEVPSTHATRSGGTLLRKRRLELAASEERAKIKKKAIKEQEQIDLELQDRRLQLQLAELEDYDGASGAGGASEVIPRPASESQVSRTQEWVNASIDRRRSEHRQLEPEKRALVPNDMVQLTSAITQAIAQARDKTDDNIVHQQLVTRLTSRDLPTFDGDPLEWPRFKRAFEESTTMGGYSENENVSRLYRSLRKEAREAVASLMIAPAKLSQIMETLQLRFGNPEMVARRISREIRRLVRLDSSRGNLVVFATSVKNCVTAMEAIGHLGYLHSPELHAEIISKIPESMIHSYNRYYNKRNEPHTPKLMILADFLRFEADIACQAGTSNLTIRAAPPERAKDATRHRADERSRREYLPPAIVFNTRNEKSRRNDYRIDRRPTETGQSRTCDFCLKKGHMTTQCYKLSGSPVELRWRWASKAKVCFQCLKSDHHRNKCNEKPCQHPECGKAHHALLHTEKRSVETPRPARTISRGGNASTHATNSTWDGSHERILLKIVPVKLQGPKACVETYALLDEGSTVTLLDADIADQIGAPGAPATLDLRGVGQMHTEVPSSRRVEFEISGTGENKQVFLVSGARTVPNLKIHRQSLSREDVKNYEYLDNIKLPLYDEAIPKVLIGQDYWDLLTPIEIRAGSRNSPVASLTQLGWVVHGCASAKSIQNRNSKTLVTIENLQGRMDRDLHNLVKAYFSLDSMGITIGRRKNIEDQRAEEIMLGTARKLTNRWEIGLLWKFDHVHLPDSYPNALKRLQSLENKMEKNVAFRAAYHREVENLITNGYARKITPPPRHDRTWYLPHFGVTHPNKPGKLRMVFDAAAKTKGTALNDQLLSGPDLLNSLLGVLMRFRQKPIAFTADIKEMFLQIQIREEDRCSQLFLWRDGDSNRKPDIYQMTSMIFGATSSPTAAMYIKDLNARQHEAEFPNATQAIIRKHYMDDYLDSVDTVEQATRMISQVTHIHHQGGFEIRGWTSNRPEALSGVPEDRRAKGAVDLSLNEETEERTLGLIWKPHDDVLSFATNLERIPSDILAGNRRPTKREMLRIIMSVFDPQGLLMPYTVGSKVILQDVWRSGIAWDDRLADGEFPEWQRWIERLKDVPKCTVPRCYLARGGNPSEAQLHIFCDASKQAFAAVGYWRFTNHDNDYRVAFIAAKSRVAPLKPALTIPRMELQAALLGTRLATTIAAEHDIHISQQFFWSDARAVLCWIRSDSRRHTAWLSNRLAEIDSHSDIPEWRWVPSEENPADDATRSNAKVPTWQSRWFNGPSFLTTHESQWPHTAIRKADYNTSEDARTEVTTNVTVSTSSSLPDLSRFSSWTRLIRATACVLLFVEVYLKKVSPEITVSHLRRAEVLWTRRAQLESFREEITTLLKGKNVVKTSRLIQLSPIVDEDGILRVRGRISRVEGVEEVTKSPAILDKRHSYAKLLVKHLHQRAGHGSTETVLNELRQKYWVVHARPTIRSVAASCQWCRVQKAKPRVPLMSDLPSARLAHHQRPFTRCGVDYFGPMTVTVGRRHEKRWGVLFTCLTTRAIHLEVAASLTTDSTIMALRRFAARRGYPTEIWSDNGTNLRGAATELRKEIELLDVAKLKSEALNYRMTWRFIPPCTPHMGGSWERLVRSVKVALQTTLRGQSPKEETLSTALAEAEHSVNSRPLVHVSTDPNDPEALTPNHFLIGTSSGVAIPIGSSEADLSSRRQWRIAQRLADNFWARWLKEYLPTLQLRNKWNENQPSIGEGDVVFLVEANTPRNVWKRGIVTRVFPDKDGRTRVAEVRSGERTYVRAVAKLVTLVPSEKGTDVTPPVPVGRMSPTQQ